MGQAEVCISSGKNQCVDTHIGYETFLIDATPQHSGSFRSTDASKPDCLYALKTVATWRAEEDPFLLAAALHCTGSTSMVKGTLHVNLLRA